MTKMIKTSVRKHEDQIMKSSCLVGISFWSLSSLLTASEIQKGTYENGLNVVQIVGEIQPDDAGKFKSIVRGLSKGVVVLSSPGGAIVPALEMGREIREAQFVTAVPADTLCASACGLIWLAGSERYAEEDSYIGFHAAYTYKGGATAESGMANALIGSYLNDLGLPDSAIAFVTNAPPEGMERLTKSKGRQIGISYTSIMDEKRVQKTTASTMPKDGYDPISAVNGFYRALSVGDGEMAASFVVPEKRGKGPFNEVNISTYYGNMIKPLTIKSIKMKKADTVEVSYSYKSPQKTCEAIALVETERTYGNTLIKKIKAKC